MLLNKLFGTKAKAWSSVVAEALTLAVAYYGTGNRWVAVAVAAAGALGVYAVPNAAAIARRRRGAAVAAVAAPADTAAGEVPAEPGRAVHDQ